jgi:hypothetical protein
VALPEKVSIQQAARIEQSWNQNGLRVFLLGLRCVARRNLA